MKTVIDMLTYCCGKNLIYLLSLQTPFPIHHVICAGSKVRSSPAAEVVRRERDGAYIVWFACCSDTTVKSSVPCRQLISVTR